MIIVCDGEARAQRARYPTKQCWRVQVPYHPRPQNLQIGDPLQRVHWRATARTGELQCRVYDPTSLAGATILVDFFHKGFPSRGEPMRSDLAVTTACSIAYAVTMLNQQIGFASNGRDAGFSNGA